MAELKEEEAAHNNVRTPETKTLGLLTTLKTEQPTPTARTEVWQGAWKFL